MNRISSANPVDSKTMTIVLCALTLDESMGSSLHLHLSNEVCGSVANLTGNNNFQRSFRHDTRRPVQPVAKGEERQIPGKEGIGKPTE